MDHAAELDDEADAPEPADQSVAHPAPRPGLFARFRNYAWDWRAVVAVGIATFIIGGLAGLAVGLAAGSGHGRDHDFRYDPGHMRFGPGGQGPGPGQGFGPGNRFPNGG